MSMIEQPQVASEGVIEESYEIRQITADTKAPARAIVLKDNGQFSSYMDSGKFAQLWRVGVAFSQSTMVPAHFKNKQADCFIVCQMAMRLGIDPFMLLQKTYVIGGKPAMEAQIAIALVNTSGLFKTNIRYEITGEGDDRGCVAWVLDQDGQRLNGPRVTMGTAKSEGWLGRNGSKWRTIPELMMQYRAATWFARLYCPERLMGMLTDDEARDIEAQPSNLSERLKTEVNVARAKTPNLPPTTAAPAAEPQPAPETPQDATNAPDAPESQPSPPDVHPDWFNPAVKPWPEFRNMLIQTAGIEEIGLAIDSWAKLYCEKRNFAAGVREPERRKLYLALTDSPIRLMPNGKIEERQ